MLSASSKSGRYSLYSMIFPEKKGSLYNQLKFYLWGQIIVELIEVLMAVMILVIETISMITRR